MKYKHQIFIICILGISIVGAQFIDTSQNGNNEMQEITNTNKTNSIWANADALRSDKEYSLTTKRVNNGVIQVSKRKRYLRHWNFGRPEPWGLEKEIKKEKIPNGIIEVSKYPNSKPSKGDIRRAYTLYSESFNTAKKRGWFNYSNGIKDGFYEFSDKTHNPNDEYLYDGETLNPQKPEVLMYYEDPGNSSKKILAGVMFMANSIEDEGTQIGGPMTVWHYHKGNREFCYREGVMPIGSKENCTNGTVSDRGPEMVHVWFVKHPKGQFATGMSFPGDEKITRAPEKMNMVEFERRERKLLASNY